MSIYLPTQFLLINKQHNPSPAPPSPQLRPSSKTERHQMVLTTAQRSCLSELHLQWNPDSKPQISDPLLRVKSDHAPTISLRGPSHLRRSDWRGQPMSPQSRRGLFWWRTWGSLSCRGRRCGPRSTGCSITFLLGFRTAREGEVELIGG